MGVIGDMLAMVFGNGRNVVRETAEVFRENAEAGAQRAASLQGAALTQLSAEFARPSRTGFDRLMDGVNRVPRPAMALGTLGLFVAAMVDPIWFAERMQGIALVPEPLWWLLGVIVSFYFGARHQVKHQQFQKDIAKSLARAPQVAENIRTLRALRSDSPGVAAVKQDAALALAAVQPDANLALDHWKAQKRAA
jgi:hypothetical protein